MKISEKGVILKFQIISHMFWNDNFTVHGNYVNYTMKGSAFLSVTRVVSVRFIYFRFQKAQNMLELHY